MLFQYEKEIRENPWRRYLFLPIFVNGNHWVLVHVDFQRHCIEYGDSIMNPQSLKKAIQILQSWLQYAFKTLFHDARNFLAHGIQEDTHSCGICTINCIKHNVFGVELYTHTAHRIWRLRYFNCLAKAHNDYSNVWPTKGYFLHDPADLLDNDETQPNVDS
ncbi:hypothetical protein HETIRDRAFT_163560 [Heterobasidion irregulare TC 32-1]|uniref:Ubiquitin-like protease family profile domain-containing protein n=1 Tax=Heterobasidion irregulare (strain TC 32-1) TaxID=747525 RepID=W4KBC4_HETIT|nr:uncharacterized protein HETIRDRAFT_163560 [Heterobasidion irregulare TC 32-1]ETW83147.1 hypothetical protein HETIRDRAFT_163560 [Heterobasidion irregulare TC 32-1]